MQKVTANSSEVVKRGPRIVLTPLHLDNIYRHFEWNNDAELNKFDSETPVDAEPFSEFKERFERMVLNPLPSERDFEIHTTDGALIGVAFITSINPHNRNCIVGLTIGERNYWGWGYGRETIELLLDYCFNDLNMHRVASETFAYNEAWTRLVENTGFVREGEEREYLFRDGRYWGKIILGMLDREYRQRDQWLPATEKAHAP